MAPECHSKGGMFGGFMQGIKLRMGIVREEYFRFSTMTFLDLQKEL